MKSILVKTTAEKEAIKELIGKSLPSYRQAYSDRTAWLMACMSELAYLKFNPSVPSAAIINKIADLLDGKHKKSLLALIKTCMHDHEEVIKTLEQDLLHLGDYCIVKTFDREDTQAILVKNKKNLILAFRGTERDSLKDIKTDIKAVTKACETGGKIHSGFHEAYEQVVLDIENALDTEEFENMPLFITGHSLGGALAMIAAKKITHKGGNAACYTFGSPRVGDEVWISNIKTPLYRVVNAADCVTMLPPGAVPVEIFGWLIGFIPYIGKCGKTWLLSKFGGYMHGGDMRYMTNCEKNAYNDVKLLYSVSLLYRAKAFFVRCFYKALIADHFISIYRKKLMVIAKKRNQLK